MLALRGGTPVRTTAWPAWPEHGAQEIEALKRVLDSREWGGYPAPGEEAKRFGEAFAKYVGTKHAVMAANGTVTLKVCLRAMGVAAGDEVIVPTLTWVATAGAAVYLNAVPVFVDVDPETLCIDPKKVEEAITARTKAVVPVHLGATMADMDALVEICQKNDLKLLEDCAHAHGAEWSGKGAGSIGDAGSFSFQSSKLMTSGEGGAITTNSDDLAQRCQSLVNCGRKEDWYVDFDGVMFGWNDRITELQAALLGAQLERLPEQKERRAKNLDHFLRRLAELGEDFGIKMQKRDSRITRSACYEVVLLYDADQWKGVSRDRFLQALEAEGVPADGTFYVPIPDRIGEIFPLRASDCPSIEKRYGAALSPDHSTCPAATDAAYNRTVWLHHSLFLGSTADVDDVVDAMIKIKEGIDELV